MSSKKKRSPCPFASAKKPAKRKKVSKSFDKDFSNHELFGAFAVRSCNFLICTRTCPFVSCPLFMRTLFRACLHGGGGPQVGEVTRLAVVEKWQAFYMQTYNPGVPG